MKNNLHSNIFKLILSGRVFLHILMIYLHSNIFKLIPACPASPQNSSLQSINLSNHYIIQQIKQKIHKIYKKNLIFS